MVLKQRSEGERSYFGSANNMQTSDLVANSNLASGANTCSQTQLHCEHIASLDYCKAADLGTKKMVTFTRQKTVIHRSNVHGKQFLLKLSEVLMPVLHGCKLGNMRASCFVWRPEKSPGELLPEQRASFQSAMSVFRVHRNELKQKPKQNHSLKNSCKDRLRVWCVWIKQRDNSTDTHRYLHREEIAKSKPHRKGTQWAETEVTYIQPWNENLFTRSESN